jgi:hypothetical protein
MLWSYTREQIVKAVLKIAQRKGLIVKKVYSLSTGLWADVLLNNGHIISFKDYEVQEVINEDLK